MGCIAERDTGAWPAPGHSNRALPNTYWHKSLGLKGFLDPYRGFRECSANRPVPDPHGRVVWGRGQGKPGFYPSTPDMTNDSGVGVPCGG